MAMRKYDVLHQLGQQVISRETFSAPEKAEAFYRDKEPGHLGRVELWVYEPPRRVVMGHAIAGGWRLLRHKNGAEEFA